MFTGSNNQLRNCKSRILYTDPTLKHLCLFVAQKWDSFKWSFLSLNLSLVFVLKIAFHEIYLFKFMIGSWFLPESNAMTRYIFNFLSNNFINIFLVIVAHVKIWRTFLVKEHRNSYITLKRVWPHCGAFSEESVPLKIEKFSAITAACAWLQSHQFVDVRN